MTCLTNAGYADGECIRATAARNIAIARLAALTLIAIDNANQAIDNFKKQWRIAKRGLVIAKEEQSHLEQTYWPRELQFLGEFGMTGGAHDGVEVIETVETLGRRYAGRMVSAIADRFAKRIDETKANFSRYNASANRKALQDLLLARSETIAAARVLGRNIAWAEVMSREETDWNRRMAAVVMGKGLIAQAQSLMQSAGAIYGDIGQRALEGLNSAMNGVGNSLQTIMSSQQRIQGAYNNPFPTQGGNWNGYAPGTSNAQGIGSTNHWSTGSYFGGKQPTWGVNNIGLGSTQQAMSSTVNANGSIDNSGFDPRGTWDGSLTGSQGMSNWTGADMQMSPGVVGTTDLVRTGNVTFPVQGITGGSVTVRMDQFPVAYADGQKSKNILTTPPPEL